MASLCQVPAPNARNAEPEADGVLNASWLTAETVFLFMTTKCIQLPTTHYCVLYYVGNAPEFTHVIVLWKTCLKASDETVVSIT